MHNLLTGIWNIVGVPTLQAITALTFLYFVVQAIS